MFADEKHLFRQSPTLTLSLMTSLCPRAKANFGIRASARIGTRDFCCHNSIDMNCFIFPKLFLLIISPKEEETLIQETYVDNG